MGTSPLSSNRRGFIKKAATLTTGIVGVSLLSPSSWSRETADEGINVIGPKEGFSPQVGTLVSMMNWMRATILRPVQNMTVEQLDYLHDSKSNSIGAMLLHLAATERYYQLHTFEGKKWGTWDESIKRQWDIPMNLGDAARKTIKGRNLDYYLNALKEVRESTLQEFRKRDDKWLMAVDKEWGWGPTNNYCKWFHVCEHESNHNGQIKWVKSRLPGAKSSGD
jgi:uncharacterized damage-inducible protein DinB